MEREDGRRVTPPAKWIKWLLDEADLWKTEGLISEEQYSNIAGRYSAAVENTAMEDRKSSRFIAVISILGSILLGLGIILFFASNWRYITVPFKLGLIFGLITLTYGAGYWLVYEKKTYTGIGKALILLGVLFFGGGIWLVAQIFNINAHYPDGILYWALGALAVAWATRLKPVIAAAVVLLAIWAVVEQGSFQNVNYLYLLILLVGAFPLVFIEKSRLSAALGALALALWFAVANAVWQRGDVGVYVFAGLLMYFVFLYAFSGFQASLFKYTGFETIFRLISMFGVFITLYALTFRGMEESLWNETLKVRYPYGLIAVYTVLPAGWIAMTAWRVLRGNRERTGMYGIVAQILLIAVTLAYAFIPLMKSALPYKVYLFTVIYNLIFFALVIAVLALGFKERRPVYINMALIFFVIDVITRYFDYMWKLLPRSIFFIFGGIILLAGGVLLENRRRKIIRELR